MTKLDPRIKAIADRSGFSLIFSRAAEEFAEASAALLQYRRATYFGDGDASEKFKEMVSELADCQVMLEQILYILPELQEKIKQVRDFKIERTLERYGINIEKENAND